MRAKTKQAALGCTAGDHYNVQMDNDVDGRRERFEAKLCDLSGRQISAVDYWDIHSAGLRPSRWDYGDWHHAVMGVELTTDLGPVTVTSTNTFHPYGVDVFHDPIEDHLVLGEAGPQRVGPDTDRTGPWTPRLGSPIRGTRSHWERLEIGPSWRADGSIVGPGYMVDLPTALRIDLDSGPVWFVAAIPQPPEMADVFIPGDEIMVVFSHKKMRNIGFHDPTFLR